MKRQDHRQGFTLIELLVAISVSTVLLIINIGWIHQTMKFASRTTQQQRQHKNLTRLAREFRDDVQASQSISMDGNDRLILKQAGERQVTYTIAGTELSYEKRGDTPIAFRDVFALSPASVVQWDTSELPDAISLIVYRDRHRPYPDLTETTPVSSTANDQMPVELHVRVSPNRWALDGTEKSTPSPENKEAK